MNPEYHTYTLPEMTDQQFHLIEHALYDAEVAAPDGPDKIFLGDVVQLLLDQQDAIRKERKELADHYEGLVESGSHCRRSFALTILMILISACSFAQLGIEAGVNTNGYNHGDPEACGLKYRTSNIAAGVYDIIHLKERIDLQVSLLYTHGGMKCYGQVYRDSTVFKATYIQLPVTIGLKVGNLTFQAGAYYSRLIFAGNHDFFHPDHNLGWNVNKWTWYNRNDLGAIIGISYDFHGLILDWKLKQGISNVRGHDWDLYRSNVLWGSRNIASTILLQVPFKVKK